MVSRARIRLLVHGAWFFFLSFTVLISLVVISTPVYASSEIEGKSTGDAVTVTVENRKSVRQEILPRKKYVAPISDEASQQVITDTRSRVQNDLEETEPPVQSTVCFVGTPEYQSRTNGTYLCNRSEPEDEEPAQAAPGAPAGQAVVEAEPVEIVITSSDLMELIPNSPQILMDQGPFGLKNAHTNFYASHHRPQTVTRTMFDQSVAITATPVEYRWDYGDGQTLVTDLPGHPVDVFNTETDTSHQYTDTGLYTIGLTTVFEGTYQVDGGPVQSVSSPVTQQAAPIEIRIWRAVTRNVDQTCLQNPSAWGCDTPGN